MGNSLHLCVLVCVLTLATFELASAKPETGHPKKWWNCGNCWTSECGFCSNPNCAIKYDLSQLDARVIVRSVLNMKKYNTIVLYDTEGVHLGSFMWNLRAFYLSGCIQCGRYCNGPSCTCGDVKPIPHQRGLPTQWSLSLRDAVLVLEVGGVDVFEFRLADECAEHYTGISYVAFDNMWCDQCAVQGGMEPGDIFSDYSDSDTICRQKL